MTGRFNFRYFILQLFLIFCLFFALTGGAFIIGWEQLKPYRDLHRFLSIASVVIAAAVSCRLYTQDKSAFFHLEPFKTIRRFFELPAWISVGLLTFIYFATQFIYLAAMHTGQETSLWDLAIYDQVIWNTAHGNFLITSVRGGLHVFCEHFKAIFVLLSLVYRFTDHLFGLLLVYVLIVSSVVVLTYLICKAVTSSHAVALVFSMGAFFYQPMRNGIDFLFHTQMLADPFILFGFLFIMRRQFIRAVIFFSLALVCKENISIEVLGIGLFLISRKEKGGWLVLSLAAAFLASYVLIIEPHFHYPYHFLNKWNLFSHLTHPTQEAWRALLEPNPVVFLCLMFGPFLFLSFKTKGWFWLLAPSLAFRLLNGMTGFRMINVHYQGGFDALVIISAIYGFASVANSVGNRRFSFPVLQPFLIRNLILGALLLSAFAFSGKQQLLSLDRYVTEASNPEYQRINKIMDNVPPQYSVLTNEMLSAHLSHRAYLYVFFSMFPHAPLEEAAKHPDLIIEDADKITVHEREVVDDALKNGYRFIFEYSFVKIYANPAVQVPQELINRWEGYKNIPAVPYRTISQFGFRLIYAIAVLFLIVSSVGSAKKLKPSS